MVVFLSIGMHGITNSISLFAKSHVRMMKFYENDYYVFISA